MYFWLIIGLYVVAQLLLIISAFIENKKLKISFAIVGLVSAWGSFGCLMTFLDHFYKGVGEGFMYLATMIQSLHGAL